MNKWKLFIDGQWLESSQKRQIHSPYDNSVVSEVFDAGKSEMEKAMAAASRAFRSYRQVSRYARSRLLEEMVLGITERSQDLARAIVLEAGKPLTQAEVEVSRAITTFKVAAEEAKRFGGEVVPIDVDKGGRAYEPAVSFWTPRGPVLGITPFNFPVNLVAHKVAPALASGCPILIKPAPQTPGGATILAEIFEKAAKKVSDSRDEIPMGVFQVVSCANEVAGLPVVDPRMTTLSFTGSGKVGWHLQSQAVGKKVALELGGNAGVIVHSDADLARAANRCAVGGNSYAGQTCISVQRIFVHKAIEKRFLDLLVKETESLVAGDPLKKETVVGPVINSEAGDRIMNWISDAKKRGARILVGGERQGNVIRPAILTGVERSAPISCEEAFGPVVVVETYDAFQEAIDGINDSRYGLQAGLFTDSSKLIRQAIDELDTGGVMINEIPTFRADQMPYGGMKESGLGREGLRYAMEEYSERKVVVSWRG